MIQIPARVLVVDDEPSSRLSLAEILRLEGYAVTAAGGGAEAVAQIEVQPFDLIITDLKMPEVDGLAVLEAARKVQPEALIILLTAYGTLDTAVQAIRQGAFDYLLKPASPASILETVQRAEADLEDKARRQRLLDQMAVTLQELKGPGSALEGEGETRDRILVHAGIIVDLDQHTVTAFGKPLELTPTEFAILALLIKQPGRTYTSEEILREVKGFSPVPGSAQAAVRVYISRLRQKLETDPKRPRYLQTVRGIGYRFSA